MDLCFELAMQIMERLAAGASPVDEVHGFRYFDDRDLMGSSTDETRTGKRRSTL